MTTTTSRRLLGADRGPLGYWRLRPGPGEAHVVRGELLPGARSGPAGEPLLTVGHLSDLHVCDAQSPARLELLDRWADEDAPTRAALRAANGTGDVGTYRAQDCLTVAVAEAAVRALDAVASGPVGGAPLDWALTTGDVTDNAQANEVGWYLALLDGGRVEPDSGDPSRYEGVADLVAWDEAYWHPDPLVGPDGRERPDRPRRLHGFPDAPGLLDAVRRPFEAAGLGAPWLAVHGNHDQMVQGTLPARGALAGAATGSAKPVGVPEHWSTDALLAFLRDVDECRPGAFQKWEALRVRQVAPDPRRAHLSRGAFVAAHFTGAAQPVGHGFARPALAGGRGDAAWYRHDTGRVTLLALDTVDEHGGWQGSLDAEQLAWLEGELAGADRERRYVVLASHHPLRTLVNAATAAGAPARALAEEVAAALAGHPSLVLWLNGHTHASRVLAHGGGPSSGRAGGAWWEVTTPSLIDFPQQGRVVELLRSATGTLTIATTMVDHAGEAPWSGRLDSPTALAGLSRELAANDWQRRVDDLGAHPRAGAPGDRNALLQLADPFAG